VLLIIFTPSLSKWFLCLVIFSTDSIVNNVISPFRRLATEAPARFAEDSLFPSRVRYTAVLEVVLRFGFGLPLHRPDSVSEPVLPVQILHLFTLWHVMQIVSGCAVGVGGRRRIWLLVAEEHGRAYSGGCVDAAYYHKVSHMLHLMLDEILIALVGRVADRPLRCGASHLAYLRCSPWARCESSISQLLVQPAVTKPC